MWNINLISFCLLSQLFQVIISKKTEIDTSKALDINPYLAAFQDCIIHLVQFSKVDLKRPETPVILTASGYFYHNRCKLTYPRNQQKNSV